MGVESREPVLFLPKDFNKYYGQELVRNVFPDNDPDFPNLVPHMLTLTEAKQVNTNGKPVIVRTVLNWLSARPDRLCPDELLIDVSGSPVCTNLADLIRYSSRPVKLSRGIATYAKEMGFDPDDIEPDVFYQEYSEPPYVVHLLSLSGGRTYIETVDAKSATSYRGLWITDKTVNELNTRRDKLPPYFSGKVVEQCSLLMNLVRQRLPQLGEYPLHLEIALTNRTLSSEITDDYRLALVQLRRVPRADNHIVELGGRIGGARLNEIIQAKDTPPPNIVVGEWRGLCGAEGVDLSSAGAYWVILNPWMMFPTQIANRYGNIRGAILTNESARRNCLLSHGVYRFLVRLWKGGGVLVLLNSYDCESAESLLAPFTGSRIKMIQRGY